ncbi:hypothetical protein Tco_0958893 [Tanacetum coccineum]
MNPNANLYSTNGFLIVTMLRKNMQGRLNRKKGYVLDDVWEKCQQNYKKPNEAWHDEGYEEDEMWRSGDKKTVAVVIRDFNKKFYNSLGSVPNRCSIA